MRTTHLPTVCVLMAATRCHYQCFGRGGGVGPEVKKFEQVSLDHQQMSVAGGSIPPMKTTRCP